MIAASLAWLESPLRPPPGRRMEMLAIAPQFWGYFATPREKEFEVFRWRDGAWHRADAPLSAATNLFGLRRATVNHGAEFQSLVAQAGDHWTTESLTAEQLPGHGSDTLQVRNLARSPQLCGDILIVSRPAVPWAWSRSTARIALPTRFANLTVQC